MKTKLVLIIIGAILLGIFIGVLLAGRYTQHKVVKIKEMGTGEGIHRRFYRLIDPTEVQHENIKPIMQEFARQSDNLRIKHWQEHKELLEKMIIDLKPYLDKEQIERLEEFKDYREPFRKHRRTPNSQRNLNDHKIIGDSILPLERRERRRDRIHN